MDIENFSSNFYEMEKELKLFSKKIDGISWWDPVRHDVFNFLYNQFCNEKKAAEEKIKIRKRVYNWLWKKSKRLTLTLKINFLNYDVLVLRAPRNLSPKGTRTDIILDSILPLIPQRKLIIDTYPHYYHLKLPSKSRKKLNPSDLCNLNLEVKKRFGKKIDVENYISLIFNQYKVALIQYTGILKKLSPKFILMVQNGVEKALFCTARARSIPVIEAQHGLINHYHPAYSYPSEIKAGVLNTLPTIFLTFSSYWSENCNYPVDKSIVIGNKQFNMTLRKESGNDILVISSKLHQKSIERVLFPAAEILYHRRFVCKLHPNQFTSFQNIETDLRNKLNIELISNQKTLQQLFERCSTVLCINSTGVYEALQAGLRVFLIKEHDYKKHMDVFDHPNLRLIQDHKDLVDLLISHQENIDLARSNPIFFQKFDKTPILELMKDLCK